MRVSSVLSSAVSHLVGAWLIMDNTEFTCPLAASRPFQDPQKGEKNTSFDTFSFPERRDPRNCRCFFERSAGCCDTAHVAVKV